MYSLHYFLLCRFVEVPLSLSLLNLNQRRTFSLHSAGTSPPRVSRNMMTPIDSDCVTEGAGSLDVTLSIKPNNCFLPSSQLQVTVLKVVPHSSRASVRTYAAVLLLLGSVAYNTSVTYAARNLRVCHAPACHPYERYSMWTACYFYCITTGRPTPYIQHMRNVL
jgi:hypothetical protein